MATVPQIAPWSDAEIAAASHMWSRDGLTAAQISRALFDRFGTRRGETVILKLASRLRDKFPARGAGHKALSRIGDRLGKTKGFVERPTPAAAAAYDAASLQLRLEDLRSCQCRFPTKTDGSLHLFCGAVAQPAKPYCEHHAVRASGAGLVVADLEASQGEKTACPA